LPFEEIITTLIKETEEDKDHGGKVLLKSQYESLFGVLVQIDVTCPFPYSHSASAATFSNLHM